MVDSISFGAACLPLSSLAAVLSRLGPSADEQKVALLKAAIANGEYQIDLATIADGIVRFGDHSFGETE